VVNLNSCPSWAGMVGAAFVVDAYSRRIIGWRTAVHPRTALVLDTLAQARWTRQQAGRPAGLICNSDAGPQYASVACTERVAKRQWVLAARTRSERPRGGSVLGASPLNPLRTR
jgi:transposase InsO family protein